jgi:hypothetical protein
MKEMPSSHEIPASFPVKKKVGRLVTAAALLSGLNAGATAIGSHLRAQEKAERDAVTAALNPDMEKENTDRSFEETLVSELTKEKTVLGSQYVLHLKALEHIDKWVHGPSSAYIAGRIMSDAPEDVRNQFLEAPGFEEAYLRYKQTQIKGAE